MSDLISRQDAIEAVIAEGRKVYTSECANAERIVYEADAVEVLAMLPSADRPTGWIPVSEKLPDLRTEVIYSFDGIVSTGYMTDRDYEGEKTESHWEDLESGVTIGPIAWMPLPEPYKGGEEDV